MLRRRSDARAVAAERDRDVLVGRAGGCALSDSLADCSDRPGSRACSTASAGSAATTCSARRSAAARSARAAQPISDASRHAAMSQPPPPRPYARRDRHARTDDRNRHAHAAATPRSRQHRRAWLNHASSSDANHLCISHKRLVHRAHETPCGQVREPAANPQAERRGVAVFRRSALGLGSTSRSAVFQNTKAAGSAKSGSGGACGIEDRHAAGFVRRVDDGTAWPCAAGRPAPGHARPAVHPRRLAQRLRARLPPAPFTKDHVINASACHHQQRTRSPPRHSTRPPPVSRAHGGERRHVLHATTLLARPAQAARSIAVARGDDEHPILADQSRTLDELHQRHRLRPPATPVPRSPGASRSRSASEALRFQHEALPRQVQHRRDDPHDQVRVAGADLAVDHHAGARRQNGTSRASPGSSRMTPS